MPKLVHLKLIILFKDLFIFSNVLKVHCVRCSASGMTAIKHFLTSSFHVSKPLSFLPLLTRRVALTFSYGRICTNQSMHPHIPQNCLVSFHCLNKPLQKGP